jgi:uncharacterized membrane protein
VPTVSQSIDIHAKPDQVESVYRDFESYPTFIGSIVSVKEHDDLLDCHLRVAGIDFPYTARVEAVKPGEYRWETVDGSISHRGAVHIRPHGAVTQLAFDVEYDVPGGALGHLAGKIVNWTGLVDSGLRHALECTKAHIEAQ